MSRLSSLLEPIRFARQHVLTLLEPVKQDDWFRMPSEGVTHIAWQIGHLAVAEYMICLHRIRGVLPGDEQLVPQRYKDLFAKGSQPSAERSAYPEPDEIWTVFQRVHEQTLAELSALNEAVLDEPIATQHHVIKTKGQCLPYQAWHEATHAGQIALLKRLLGYPSRI